MKIYNITSKKIIFISALIIILIILFAIAMHLIKDSDVIQMTTDNYTEILKECHKDPYKYINKKITSVGYIFRNENFSPTQFVTARDMLISKNESRIVGFLCEYENIKEFEDNVWVSIEGILTIGDYYGAMPIIKVNKIQKITTPNDIFVNPPSGE